MVLRWLTAMWYGGCEMKRNEIAPTVIIVLLSIVIMVQAVMAEPCRQHPPVQINEYDKGQYR